MKKMALLFLFFLTLAYLPVANAQQPKPVKNVVVMIPDGTSIGVVSAARWYQLYNQPGAYSLQLDPYLCGSVVTHSSNAPIGCSASTTSCYMTGSLLRAGQVAIYPEADPGNDILPIDPSRAYQPLATVLEAAKTLQNKSTGLVVTCYFTHATPADCAAHYYDRGDNKRIALQMAYNNIDVVLGGGMRYITDDIRHHLNRTGVTLIDKDLPAFRNHPDSGKLWALFAEKGFPYEYDRDTTQVPSLEEMTRKALALLSKNENGFFLMVEGSNVDKAAHAHDVLGCITEFLAFDKAVGAVMEFAEKDGETAVVILPDHATGGFTLGNNHCGNYVTKTLSDLFGMISSFQNTGEGIAQNLMKESIGQIRQSFKDQTGIELTDAELQSLINNKDVLESDYMEVANTGNVISTTNRIINSHSCFGFTTGGHVGDEVFLAAYHPQGHVPMGVKKNYEINEYLCRIMALEEPLTALSDRLYAKHTDVFDGYSYQIKTDNDSMPVLVVKKGKKTLEVPAFKSIAYLNGEVFDLGSVTVYIDRNDTFYLPRSLSSKL